jgi:Na+-translocating ferredoxin:NAD+ oxidoreductase RnfD subunit
MAKPEEISINREIDALISAQPFQPFSIVMASGSKYEIAGNDAAAVGRTVITIYAFGGGKHLLQERRVSEVNIPGSTS